MTYRDLIDFATLGVASVNKLNKFTRVEMITELLDMNEWFGTYIDTNIFDTTINDLPSLRDMP